jgi:hypothetical protein
LFSHIKKEYYTSKKNIMHKKRNSSHSEKNSAATERKSYAAEAAEDYSSVTTSSVAEDSFFGCS